MFLFLAKRFGASGLIVIGITFITFLLSYFIPADPVRMLAGRSATQETVESIRHQLGLDQPLPVQYLKYLGRLVQGDLGRSYKQKTQVAELIASRMPATLKLLVGAIFFEVLFGIPAGIFAASRRGRKADNLAMIASFVGVSAPQFVVGLLLLWVFAYKMALYPLGGYGGLSHLILPAVTLGITGGGWYSRMMRSSMVDVLQQDYIRTARAKGVRESAVVLVHGLRNAVLPVIAMIGMDIGFFMSWTVVVESVYGWPGIGQLTWQSIQVIDTPVIMGVTLVAALAIVIGNFMADLIMPLIDPRLRVR
ncbi:MAG: ABC transporter permease [Desulfohalobiaceae bacterium]|nr:ABC transporter permease [Desulfohalobiaceae bacterium]